MSKNGISKLARELYEAVAKHSPEILTGIGIAGMVTTTVLAVKATPKALRIIEAEKEEVQKDKLPPLEVVKCTWKCYVPAVVTGAVSISCIIGASSVNARRNTALATAYKLSETALVEYREKVIETLGEKKEKNVREAIARDKIDNNPVNKQEVIITGKGETLCYDLMFGRYFNSDIEKLRKIENELNRRMRSEDYISLNEYFYEVGLEDVVGGHDLGWNIDKGYIELEFHPHLTKEDKPCLGVSFARPPYYGFRNYV